MAAVSPVKAIIKRIARHRGMTELDLYRAALASSLDTRSSNHLLSTLDDSEVKQFYRERGKDPKFMSSEDPSTYNLLSRLAQVHLAVYQQYRYGRQMLSFKLVDTRARDWLFRTGESEARSTMAFALQEPSAPSGHTGSTPFFGNTYELFAPISEQSLMVHFVSKSSDHSLSGLSSLASLAVLMGAAGPTADAGARWTEQEILFSSTDEAKSLLLAAGVRKSCIIVLMQGMREPIKMNGKRRLPLKRLTDPARFRFVLLWRLDVPSSEETVVLQPLEGGGWLQFNDRVAEHAAGLFSLDPAERKKKERGVKRTRESILPDDLLREQKRARKEAAEAAADAVDSGEECCSCSEPAPNVQSPEEVIKHASGGCDCDACKSATLYVDNMKVYGPQLLYKKSWTLEMLLQACGLYDDSLRRRLNYCFSLSMASMDIESTTRSLMPNARSPSCTDSSAHEVFKSEWEHVSAAPLTDETAHPDGKRCNEVKMQRPLMIGHMDFLDASIGDDVSSMTSFRDLRQEKEERLLPRVAVFEKTKEGVQAMVEYYALYLLRRREQLAAMKTRLLGRELSVVESYKAGHFAFFKSRGIEPDSKKCIEAWKFSVLGQLEESLHRMIKKLVVWSLNGSAYDIPCLTPYLVSSHAFSDSKPFITRSGSRVNSLTFSNGIAFMDMSKLCSPGVSLEKLSKSVGLSMKKVLVPYALLDEEETFLDRKELPREREAYFSELSNKTPSQEEVDETLEGYEREGFKSVREYLVRYLKTDVILLHCSAEKYVQKLWEITGLHVVDAQRYTLSSFSDYAAQVHLMRHKRVGSFIPNSCLSYSLMKRALLGGLQTTGRTSVNMGEGGDSPANNHLRHLPPSDMEMDDHEAAKPRSKLNFCHYLDISMLYSTAGNEHLLSISPFLPSSSSSS